MEDEVDGTIPRMDNVAKALALARLGIKVFPVDHETRRPVIKGNGFYDAVSDDFEKIATWFSLDYPEAEVGYWAGGSGLFVADVDRGKKNGKDGFSSIKAAGHADEMGKTHSYPTASGGEHRVFQTDRLDLTLSADYDGIEGFDIRAGGSYAVWWGDSVPESRDAFSADIPEWMTKAPEKDTFSGEGFSGSVSEWLDAIPDDVLPSSKTVDLIGRIPTGKFGHPEMIDLAWSVVRMGSERETGIRGALEALREAWLRDPYNTPEYRRDFDLAVKGAIVKAGRVQKPLPSMASLTSSLHKATEAGVGDKLKAIEFAVSETATEVDFSRTRKEMFKIAAEAGLSPAHALGIVAGSKSFKNSKVTMSSAWFGEGEPEFHDLITEEVVVDEVPVVDPEVELTNLMTRLSSEASAFTFLDEAEQLLVESPAYNWWGTEYLGWVKTRLKHYNGPYHIGSMWAALSVIASPWGKMPLQGYKPTDCNLYFTILGDSSSGKSEAWGFGRGMMEAYFGPEHSPIIGDTKKTSAMSLHHTLIHKDGAATLVYSDEVQGFFKDLQNSHWQGSILADMSDYYGGDVPPKSTMNDKEISGKSGKSLLTAYFTGIADMSFDCLSIDNWRSGFFYRFLWGFGNPRTAGDYEVVQETVAASYTAQFNSWAANFRRIHALNEVRGDLGRVVMWDKDALDRISKLNKQIDEAVKEHPLYDTVFIPANGRFLTSIMKCATLVALTEAAETVSLRHALIALSYAGPWHRSMVLAVSETGRDIFDREVEKCLTWIKRNAIRQVGKPAWIQRSSVMRAFKPNEIADRLLRQLTEEGWLIKSGDTYQLSEG